MTFQPASRYPADPRVIFILALSVFTGLTALVLRIGPESLESLLPPWAVVTWGALLTAGSMTTLLGMVRQTFNGILLERVGSITVGVTTVYYTAVVTAVVGFSGLQTVGIILAWGLACFMRAGQLSALIRHGELEAAAKAAARALAARTENPSQ